MSVSIARLTGLKRKPKRRGCRRAEAETSGRLCELQGQRPAGVPLHCVGSGALSGGPITGVTVSFHDASMGAEVRASDDAPDARANGHCDASSSGQNGTVPRLQVSTISAGRPSIDPEYGGNRTSRSRLRSEPFFIGVAGMGHFSSAGWLSQAA